jgi:hypothetical protein
MLCVHTQQKSEFQGWQPHHFSKKFWTTETPSILKILMALSILLNLMPFLLKLGMKGTDPKGNTDKTKHMTMF